MAKILDKTNLVKHQYWSLNKKAVIIYSLEPFSYCLLKALCSENNIVLVINQLMMLCDTKEQKHAQL